MGTAQVQGRLWGARARDYARLAEGAFRPLIDAVFDATGLGTGTRFLDVGCGTGLALQLAEQRGALVAGLDAAEPSVAIARERVQTADVRVGEMEELPWPDETFDVVTGFNAFQFAADPVNALRQTRRVVRSGGRVAMAIWGRLEDCEMAAVVAALGALLPPPPPGSENPFALAAPGRVEAMIEHSGLTTCDSSEVECVFAFPDLETALRGLMSAGSFVAAAEQVGAEPVRRAVSDSLAPFRNSDGGYRLRNRFRYVVAAV